MVLLYVRRTAAISCEAHIDEAKAIVKRIRLQRFVSFIALFDRRLGLATSEATTASHGPGAQECPNHIRAAMAKNTTQDR
jgi:hypothetical protein